MISKEWVLQLFRHLENGQPDVFFESVADDVIWEVTGTHPLAGIYTTKASFISGTISKLNQVLESPLCLKVVSCVCDGSRAAVELVADSYTKSGRPFNNRYCWVCEFSHGRLIKVRAYLDSALILNTLDDSKRDSQPC